MRTAVQVVLILALQLVLILGLVAVLLFSPALEGQSPLVIASIFVFGLLLTGGLGWYAISRHVIS